MLEPLGVDPSAEAVYLAMLRKPEAGIKVLAFAPDGAQTADSMRASAPLNRQLLARGVAMRTLYLTSASHDPQTVAHAQELTELGAQLRTVPVLPTRMLVVDRTWAVLPLDPERTSASAVVLRSPGVITALRALFDRIWQTGTPWGTREQAGRKLGVSTRTVGRITADLTTRLGARSRFQAGALAVARGWLEPDFIDAPPTPGPAAPSPGVEQAVP